MKPLAVEQQYYWSNGANSPAACLGMRVFNFSVIFNLRKESVEFYLAGYSDRLSLEECRAVVAAAGPRAATKSLKRMDAFQIVDGKMTDCSPFVNHFLEHLPLDPLERTLVSVELEKLFGRWVEHSYEYLKEARWGRYDQSQVSKELSSSLEEAEPFFSGIWRSIYGRIFPELSEPNDQ